MEQNKNFQKFINAKGFFFKDGIVKRKINLSSSQQQTKNSFSYLWQKKDIFDNKEFNNNQIKQLKSLYKINNRFLMQITKIKDLLDASYGTGQTSYLLFNKLHNNYIGLDVSDSIYTAKDI